jgi:hypothetical protein
MRRPRPILAVPTAIKFGHIGGAIRQGSDGRECVQLFRRRASSAHPYSMTSECAFRCSSSCTTVPRDADAKVVTPLVARRHILRQLEKLKAGKFVFPGQARGKPLSNMAMEMVLRRMNVQEATVHGFRSSFRDWAGNVSNFPREITETALALIGDKAEQAYRRSDALEKRRKLMETWASYCEPKISANILQMH